MNSHPEALGYANPKGLCSTKTKREEVDARKRNSKEMKRNKTCESGHSFSPFLFSSLGWSSQPSKWLLISVSHLQLPYVYESECVSECACVQYGTWVPQKKKCSDARVKRKKGIDIGMTEAMADNVNTLTHAPRHWPWGSSLVHYIRLVHCS